MITNNHSAGCAPALEIQVLETAAHFACGAHMAVGQKRKYSGEDYIVHPLDVCARLFKALDKEASIEMRIAALLHDVVEDTAVTLEQVAKLFGEDIACIVEGLTDVSKPEDGNRELRKAIDREHSANANYEAQTVKCFDLCSNTSDIVRQDKDFAVVYLKEKELLLEQLTKAHPKALEAAHTSLALAKEVLKY